MTNKNIWAETCDLTLLNITKVKASWNKEMEGMSNALKGSVWVLGALLLALPQPNFASPAPLKFNGEGETFVQRLYEKTSSTQTLKEKPFIGLFEWHQAQGVYKSEIKLNFYGGPAFSEFRKIFHVFDNNMFATAWVTTNLLEAYKYGAGPKPTEQQIDLALQAMAKHMDRNVAFNTSARVFWSQVYNKTINYWRTAPDNLLSLFEETDKLPVGTIEAILKTLGLGELAETIDGLIKSKTMFLQAFRVPPDFDDTFVNLGLGGILHELKDDLPSSFAEWTKSNEDIQTALNILKRYAYRPFSKNPDQNTIDPRTYYYLRGFLDQASDNGEDIALVTTWAQSISETRWLYAQGNPMPFNINNVDVTVAADVVFGLTSAVLSGLQDKSVFDDAAIAQIYLNTSSLLAYEMANNLTSRPDLALTYYPSILESYWFVAKTVSVMETYLKKGPLPSPVMTKVYDMLKDVCLREITEDILSKAQYEKEEKYYFDDFMGNADTDIFGRPVKNYEDRMFSTAMAANALLYTWTIFDPNTGKAHYRPEIPLKVQFLITGTINWLSEYTLSGKYKPWNAFFSGSMKGNTCVPFWYPANRFELLNGTAVKDWSKIPKGPFIYGVEGHIPKDQYETMMKQKHFGQATPIEFPGYNVGEAFFPFWSSESYTYSSVLLAVTRFENIRG
ncbi:hypothetical protein ElyMa_002763500 [Elysia marginata]|uniref:Uncharacterized protein n=1 Tax=Elysia marginata TaxID=1093978 RepID=A0AAV4HN67_9GAST|nr:hypothetical protein ElyMa_002763500 [Elysia marginata]